MHLTINSLFINDITHKNTTKGNENQQREHALDTLHLAHAYYQISTTTNLKVQVKVHILNIANTTVSTVYSSWKT